MKPADFPQVYYEVMYKICIFELACMSIISAESYVQTMEMPCSAGPVHDDPGE